MTVTANSVTLSWTATSLATRFKIYYTSDNVNFYLAPLPAGQSALRI